MYYINTALNTCTDSNRIGISVVFTMVYHMDVAINEGHLALDVCFTTFITMHETYLCI